MDSLFVLGYFDNNIINCSVYGSSDIFFLLNGGFNLVLSGNNLNSLNGIS